MIGQIYCPPNLTSKIGCKKKKKKKRKTGCTFNQSSEYILLISCHQCIGIGIYFVFGINSYNVIGACPLVIIDFYWLKTHLYS